MKANHCSQGALPCVEDNLRDIVNDICDTSEKMKLALQLCIRLLKD